MNIPRLSDRETTVLHLLKAGLSNKGIAAELKISIRTVETYRASLMRKLKIGRFADLVAYALHGEPGPGSRKK